MFGFDPILRDAIGVDMLDLVHPEDREVVLKGLAEDLHTSERRKRYEVRVKTKDGREIWVNALATRIEFQGRLAVLLSLKDITEQKRAEEALKEYRQDYAKLIENLSDAVFKFEDGMVVWCNDKVKEIYGYSKDELIGKDASFFIPADREPLEFIRSIYAVMKKEGCYRGLARANTKGGGTVDIEYSISQIPNRHHIELVTVARDVTERRRLEEQIQQAGRLAAVGELAAGVAHELNNPLAAILGYAQLLTKSNDLNEVTRKDLNAVYSEAQRAAKITQNLLTFARKHNPERQLVSINEAIKKTLELRDHQMSVNNIELSVQLQPDLPTTMADFYQMQQVFMNIIINAEQAMIEAHGRGRLLVKTRAVDGVIQITLIDNGPGIPKENLNRIFDPFFTTKEVGKGTGLGLSMCYGIIQAHGGRMYARSEPGKGATFVVEIPIITQDAPIAKSDE
jgi:two-component system NtrC family sensor kinase